MGLKLLQKILIIGFTGVFLLILFVGIIRYKNSSNSSSVVPINNPSNPNITGSQAQGPKDGTFTGQVFGTRYGNVGVSITIQNGKIVSVDTPSYPSSPPSVGARDSLLAQAISANSANIQGVSGATITSIAFQQSLESALSQAGGTSSSNPSQPVKQIQNRNPFFEDDD